VVFIFLIDHRQYIFTLGGFAGLNTKCPLYGDDHPDFVCPDQEASKRVLAFLEHQTMDLTREILEWKFGKMARLPGSKSRTSPSETELLSASLTAARKTLSLALSPT
jgi:hypothetical protein